ncbi:hypothetical protein AB0K89_04455 [Streptomyces cinnamoneus]|uniref:hypothetical protein n=1 Tax=Streptomyces cinnamoneus TaxID=53446 RepID=UPI003433C88D
MAKTTEAAHEMFARANTMMNRLFPLKGVPKTIRAGDQYCLQAGGCNPVKVTEVGMRHFTYLSLPGHAEGPGKHITFTLEKNGYTIYLVVDARGPKAAWQRFPLLNDGNYLFAKGMWAAFAFNMAKAAEAGVI